MPAAALTIALYGFDDPAAACARLRVFEPVRALTPAVRLLMGVVPSGPGHTVATDVLAAADLVLIQRFFPGPRTAPILEAIFASGKPVVYDTDDDFTAVPAGHPFFPRMAALVPHIRDTAGRATLVTVSTPGLAAVFRPLAARVRVVPNCLPEALWQPVAPPQRPVAAIGFAATPSHAPDLACLEPALSRLAQTAGFSGRFVFYGCPPAPGTFPGATILPFAPDYAAYAAKLPRLGLAIGLAPLADTPFDRAKSAIKWLEYTASGAAGIYADLPPYQDVVEDGQTGLLVGPQPQAWAEAVARLVADAPLRRRLAGKAREALDRSHWLATGASAFGDAWRSAAQGDTP
ncbi:glycosyltransferase [Desulfovibrio aerotolerans]|uniref:Glycosyltransferase n=2 Tax=Solidesulfovibrio aerotolerans TaxID=295255 RepID=A0A7C9IMN7_9BACT|nr:glycosyltransferase [Solidesulfovibrio aerotolerans]